MRKNVVWPVLDGAKPSDEVRMTRGRKTEDFEAKLLRSLVKHLYFKLGKLEREVASELGISRRMVNYYKNHDKR